MSHLHRSSGRRSNFRPAVTLALTAIVGACGGGDGSPLTGEDAEDVMTAISVAQEMPETEAAGDASVDGGGSEDTQAPGSDGPEPAEDEVRRWGLDAIAWWDGWTIELTELAAEGDEHFNSLLVTMTLTNRADRARGLSKAAYVLVHDGVAADSGFLTPPQVAAGGSTKVELDFFLEGPFAPENATFVLGTPDQNQAVLPLAGGEVDSFEPLDVEVTGDLSTPAVAMVVTGPAHVEPSFASAERDRYLIRIPVDLTYVGSSPGGQLVTPSQIVLGTPDGSSLVAEPRMPGDLVAEALYPNQAPLRGAINFVTLAPPEPGTYELTFTDADGAAASASFEIPSDR